MLTVKLRESSAFLKLAMSMGGPSFFPSTRKAIHLCGLLPAAPQRRDSMRLPSLTRKEYSSPERERRDDHVGCGYRTVLYPDPQVRTVVASIRPCVALPRVGPRKITAPRIRAVNSAKGNISMATRWNIPRHTALESSRETNEENVLVPSCLSYITHIMWVKCRDFPLESTQQQKCTI